MDKTNMPRKHAEISPEEKNQLKKLPVDKDGEPLLSDEDPDIIPLDEEADSNPAYEPPPPAEGP